MTYCELMYDSLNALLRKGDVLQCPIYGCMLFKRGRHCFGYFGLTDDMLLVSLLQGDSKHISATGRIPLSDIARVNIKRSLVPMQRKICISLHTGNRIKLRVSRKVYGFKAQRENLDGFMARLSSMTAWE